MEFGHDSGGGCWRWWMTAVVVDDGCISGLWPLMVAVLAVLIVVGDGW